MAPHLHIRLLCGPTTTTLTPLPVNTPSTSPPMPISPSLSARIYLRHPHAKRPPPYFAHPAHATDLFSMQLTFTPPHDVSGADLLLCNTWDAPIRHSLPYFWEAAWKALRWIDPGLDGDLKSDSPEIRSPVVSGVNYISAPAVPVSGTKGERAAVEAVVEESMPADVPAAPRERRKFFLDAGNRERWVWRAGITYTFDLCNGMVDLGDFTLGIPGLPLKVELRKYWDGQPVRFVLIDAKTGMCFGCVVIDISKDPFPEDEVVGVVGREDDVVDADGGGVNKTNGVNGANHVDGLHEVNGRNGNGYGQENGSDGVD